MVAFGALINRASMDRIEPMAGAEFRDHGTIRRLGI